MNYEELRNKIKNHLNRDDCTDTDADGFITSALRRIERLLKVRFNRETVSTTIPSGGPGTVTFPADAVSVKEVRVDGVPYARILSYQNDLLCGFILDGSDITFSPSPPSGSVVEIVYYHTLKQNFTNSSSPDYFDDLADVIEYMALSFAGDFFTDSRAAGWETKAGSLLQEVQLMTDIEDMSGGLAVTPYGGGVA